MSKQSPPLNNYLRTHRKRIGFTQKEIAFLIGSNDSAKVSHFETFKHIPQLKTSFAYEIIFNQKSKKLFLGTFEKVTKDTRCKAKELLHKLENSSSNSYSCSSSRRKRRQKIEHLKKITKVNGISLKQQEA